MANESLRQTVEILLRTGGQGDAEGLRDALAKLNAEMTAMALSSRANGTAVSALLKDLNPLSVEYRQVKAALAEVGRQEKDTAKDAEAAAGAILRAKVDGYARAERAAEQAAETERRAAGEAVRARIDAHARQERSQEQATERAKQLAGDEMRARIDGYARAERAAEQAGRAMDRTTGTAGRSSTASRHQATQLLYVSYAAQDLSQGGFGAIINNVPQLVNAFDVSTKWAGGLMLGTVAVDLALRDLGPVIEATGRELGILSDPARKFVVNLDDMKAKVEALSKRPLVLEVDYHELHAAERQLAEMEKRLAAFNAGKGDNVQREMAKAAGEAAGNVAGGTEGLEKAVVEMEGPFHGDPQLEQQRRTLTTMEANLKAKIDSGKADADDMHLYADMVRDRAATAAEAAALGEKMAEQQRAWAKQEVGKFMLGDPAAIAAMKGRAARNPGAFADPVPGGKTSADAIKALPGRAETIARLDSEAEAKRLEEESHRNQEAFRHSEARDKQAADKAVEKINQRAEYQKRLADLMASLGKTAAKNAKETTKAEADAEKLGADLTKKNDLAVARADRGQDAAAGKLAPGFVPALVHQIATNDLQRAHGGGVDPEAGRAWQTQQVANRLAMSGADPSLAPKIVKRGEEAYAQRLTAASTRHASQLEAVADVQTGTLAELNRVAQRLDGVQAKTASNRTMLSKMRNQRPSGLQLGN